MQINKNFFSKWKKEKYFIEVYMDSKEKDY